MALNQREVFTPKLAQHMLFKREYTCIYIYICVYIYIFIYMYIHIYIVIDTYIYIYMCIYMCVCIYTYISLYIHIMATRVFQTLSFHVISNPFVHSFTHAIQVNSTQRNSIQFNHSSIFFIALPSGNLT
jgi:hypothetical protein